MAWEQHDTLEEKLRFGKIKTKAPLEQKIREADEQNPFVDNMPLDFGLRDS